MKISDSDKIQILLNRLDHHSNEMQRREEREGKLYDWATAFLLGFFAGIIALTQASQPIPHILVIKTLATLSIIVPIAIIINRILTEERSISRQAAITDQIEEELGFFETGKYIENKTMYPEGWGNLAQKILKRKTPRYYVIIISLMTISVITLIWLVL